MTALITPNAEIPRYPYRNRHGASTTISGITEACQNEVDAYLILGHHLLQMLPNAYFLLSRRDMLRLKDYPNGSLEKCVDEDRARTTQTVWKCWAHQFVPIMTEAGIDLFIVA